ncbi:MAG: PD-(D/E)XK nuclease family protein [Myxococcales bacterium]|nr:PD-(D/E)XK nuclease family protein [Myxococcales bacterium]
MPPIYSHSRLSTFEDCPKRFEYRYVLKIPTETEGIEAFVGKRVHEILERLYQAAQRGQVPSLEKVLYRYHRLFEEGYDAERVRIVREETPVEFYRQSGERCLTAYYRRHYPFDGDETLGIEQRVTFALDEKREYRFQGIIDRLVRARDGAIEIHDYKTSRRASTQKQVDADRQLALYQIGLAEQFSDAPFRLVWHYLQQDRQLTSTRTPEQLNTLREDTMSVVDRITSESDFKPRRSALCDWCEYNDRCPIYPKERLRKRNSAAPPLAAGKTGQLALFDKKPQAGPNSLGKTSTSLAASRNPGSESRS